MCSIAKSALGDVVPIPILPALPEVESMENIGVAVVEVAIE